MGKSASSYPKKGNRSGIRPRGDLTQPVNERLASPHLYAQTVGPVPVERRVFNDYALQPRDPEILNVPRNPVKETKSTVTQNGIGSRGNVIHTRYLARGL